MPRVHCTMLFAVVSMCLDEFGAFAAGKPGVLFDNGYTLPNLALRILRSNKHLLLVSFFFWRR